MNETYTERLFSSSIDEIRDLHNLGLTLSEIAVKVNLSEYLVAALIERFVKNYDS